MIQETISTSVPSHFDRILVVTAVEEEKKAVQQAIADHPAFEVIVAGAGPVAAAIQTTRALASRPYSLVINAGIGGAFPGRATIGSLVIATQIIAVDLGVETTEGFMSIDQLGFGTSKVVAEPRLVLQMEEKIKTAGMEVTIGPVLTVSTATGTEETAKERAARVPNAVAEAMEGFGVCAAATSYRIPSMEIRAISNRVGLRNRKAWNIKEALQALTKAFTNIPEVLL